MNASLSNYNGFVSKETSFLNNAQNMLSPNDFHLLTEILHEWHSTASLFDLLSKWKLNQKVPVHHPDASLHILYFNVRGLGIRWGEVCLLAKTFSPDIIALGEVGHVDFSLIGASFSNYKAFYQAGENAHGGVLVLIRLGIPSTSVPCAIPNVCVIDLALERTIRLVALYAPASKTWRWSDLSFLINKQCIVMGDFNIDLEEDGEKADQLLEWMDACSLGPVVPNTNTSLRSDRTIDYALTAGVDLTIQAQEGLTTSDHKPLTAILSGAKCGKSEGSRTIWPVFSLFLSYTADFWEQEWKKSSPDDVYEQFISFISLLASRCKVYFPRNLARPSIPHELVKLLAQSRTISFKAKRTGDIRLRQEACRLRNLARYELKLFQQIQLAKQLQERHSPNESSTIFWNKTKRHFRNVTSSLKGFIQPDGSIIKDPQVIVDIAAEYYEKLLEEPVVMRPHPYVDAPPVHWDNEKDPIPPVSYPEVIGILRSRKKKQSLDIHGLSPFLLDKIPKNYWHLMVQLYNHSFSHCFIPKKCKEVRMVLLAKNDPLCTAGETRPISLLDSFLKVQEKLFLNRFLQVLKDRGILPDNQSGFRAGHRLQTRVLLLIEQIASYMANSSPVATVFVDFKSAFDQLWFEGCLGKLARMGIPLSYVNWISEWLSNRHAVIEFQGKRSRWIKINRGCPQGSSLSPTLFITYHSDMSDFIPGAMSFFFADDLAAVLAGRIGIRFTDQCLDLERRLHTVLEELELYSILAVQPINYSKTQAMFSARAIGYPNPMPQLMCGGHSIEWVSSFKYLGYWLTTKLGWGNMIGKIRVKVRQRTALVNSFNYSGVSSTKLKRVLFSTFVLPYFTWLFGLFPLFTDRQRTDIDHLYCTLLKRLYRGQCWQDFTFLALYHEKPLADRCYAYWEKYIRAWSKSRDGFLLMEQSALNSHRSNWQEGRKPIRCLYRSKRFVTHVDVVGKGLDWMASHGSSDSMVQLDEEDWLCFVQHPESF